MRVDLLLLDLDGTLIDSRRDIVAQVNAALDAAGHPRAPHEEIQRWIGRGSRYLFEKLAGKHASVQAVAALVADFQRRYGAHLTDTTRVYPGVREALERCAAIRTVIVTNKSQGFADALVDALDLRRSVPAVFGAEAFAAMKPDPLPLVETCRRFGVAPARAAMVGDTWADVAASKKAGCLTIAASWGYGDLQAMRELGPDHEIASIAELPGLLN